MKVVKLNRRFRQFKEHGHTIALRFPKGFDKQAIHIEQVCRKKLSRSSFDRSGIWYGYYGTAPDSYSSRPYWITFRNEMDLTMVMLSADLTKKL